MCLSKILLAMAATFMVNLTFFEISFATKAPLCLTSLVVICEIV